jgi:hypothetical protein
MPIVKQTISLADNITERGQVHVKTITRVIEDGSLLSESVHRKVLSPGDSLTGEAASVAAVATALWTPEVIAAWQAGNPLPAQVPQEVTRRQAKAALLQTGRLSLVQGCLDAIKAASPAQGDLVQIEWDDSQTFQRQRPSLIALATNPAPYGLGMTLAQLDELFTLAATL